MRSWSQQEKGHRGKLPGAAVELGWKLQSPPGAPEQHPSLPAGQHRLRVVEPPRLEKTFKITKSNHQPALQSPITEPHPLVPCPHIS